MASLGQRSLVHIFQDDLEKSNKYIPWLEELYKCIFPNFSFMLYYPNNQIKQQVGIDLEIFLHNGHVLKIDEKRRDTVYPDILLEYISNDATGSIGWVRKELMIDYLAYIFMPTKELYLIPWLLLKMAWSKNGDKWLNIYEHKPSYNEGYKTWNIPVPRDVLWRAINESFYHRLRN